MSKSLSRSLVFAFLTVALSAAVATGQSRTGTVEGTIVDGTGQVLPGVSVTMSGDVGASSEVAVSSGTGTYRFLAVSPGIYSLRFELGGFQTRINEGVRVDIARTTGLDVALELLHPGGDGHGRRGVPAARHEEHRHRRHLRCEPSVGSPERS